MSDEGVPIVRAQRAKGGELTFPARIGRYVVKSRLGHGGMAEVFLAEHEGPHGFSKRLVIKRLLPHLAGEQRYVDMFLREAEIVARLSHPNIVQVFELGDDDGRLFLAMEHLDGLSLARLARRAWAQGRAIPTELVIKAIADAAQGLHYAHHLTGDDKRPLELVHRDISPDNIVLLRTGVAKVVDFGIAKSVDSVALTDTGELKGKIPFMSPEQVRGEPLDGRSDIFSLGVTLYWLLTSRSPFSASTDVLALQAVLQRQPTLLSKLNPTVPRPLVDLARDMLEKKRDKRIADGLAVSERLQALVEGAAAQRLASAFVEEMLQLPPSVEVSGGTPGAPSDSQTATVAIKVARSEPEALASTPVSASLSAMKVRPSSRRGLLAGALVLLVVLGGAVAAALWPRGAPLSPPTDEPLAPVADARAIAPSSGAATDVAAAPPADAGVERDSTAASTTTERPRERRVRAGKPAPTRAVRVTAPPHVEWRTPKGKRLARGTASIELPAGVDVLLAVDTRYRGSARLAVADAVDYAALPRGRLDVRAVPFAAVRIGEVGVGTTPFSPVELVAGRYTVRLSYEAKVVTRAVTIEGHKTTQLKVNMLEE